MADDRPDDDDTLVVERRARAPSAGPRAVGGRDGRRYQLLDLVGEGGMATVHRAYDTDLDELVALKMIRRELVAEKALVERFRREAKLARRVTHKSVARIYELGEHEGTPFLTMELISGRALSKLLREDGPLDLERTVRIVRAICDGLAAAHEAGVIHRDVKPDNVLVTGEDRVVITDFGIAHALTDPSVARLTQGPLGTPSYMAPEQLEVGPLSAATDVYSLGVLVFEMLTGHLPWIGRTPWDIAVARLRQRPTNPRTLNPGIPEAAANVVLGCLELDPNARPSSVALLGEALAHAVFGTQPELVREAPLERERRELPTIAVRPFVDRGSGQYGEMVREDITDALSRLHGIRVLSTRGPPREVDLAVEGSVTEREHHVRVAARVVDQRTGFQKWADRFECAPERIVHLQDQIANSIAAALSLEARVRVHDTPLDGKAIELYLTARREVRRHDYAAAVRALEEALEWAPGHPTLLAALAGALFRWSFISPLPDLLLRARRAATEAIERAPDRGEPYLALAQSQLHAGEPARAARTLRDAVTRAPSLAEAHAYLADLLIEVRRIPDGVRRADVALALDRDLDVAHAIKIRAMALLGDWAEVDRLFEELAASGSLPLFISKIRYLAWRGDQRGMRQVAETLHSAPNTVDSVGARLVLDIFLGRKPFEEVYAYVRGSIPLGESARRRAFIAQLTAELAGFSRDTARAMDALERANAAALVDLAWIDFCPLLEPLRGEARFREIRDEVQRRADQVCEGVWG